MELLRDRKYLLAAPLLTMMLVLSPQRANSQEKPPTDGDRVIVRGTYTPMCSGTICEQIVASLSPPDWNAETLALYNEGGGGISQEQFCAEMEEAEPDNCNVDDPPSSPGYDPAWVSNGCGDGSFALKFAEMIGAVVVPNFEGDLDNPLPGVSFGGACRFHDRCYGTLLSKSSCDETFHTFMVDACNAGSTTYLSQCQKVANTYFKAVDAAGGDPYDAAQRDRTCAAWAADMEANQCN